MDKDTLDRLNAPKPFAEFPKMKYHPDGRTATVEDDAAESALGGEWLPNPAAAEKVRADRDAAEEKRAALRAGSEARAAGKTPER